jgi:dienelactone hydrolase
MDEQWPPEKRHESEEILRFLGQPYQLTLYGGVSHGFAVRGNPQQSNVQFAMDQALQQAVTWFNQFLVE